MTTALAPLFDLSGRVAIVTGASRGIGEAAAGLLRQAGAQVVLASRKQDAVDQAAARIRQQGPGPDPLPIACHVGKPDDVQALLQRTVQQLGRVDIVVNNAGTNPYFGPTLLASLEAYQKTFEINLTGAFLLSRLAAQHMIEKGARGSIVNIASVAGLRAAPLQGIYGMTKAALISMTQTLAFELGPSHIRVNAIAPGLVETRLASALLGNDEILRRIIEKTPLGRPGQPHEIAAGILFLAADASSYLTGQTLVIDGGLTIS